MRTALIICLALLCMPGATALENQQASEPSEETTDPDYSPEALSLMLREKPEEEEEKGLLEEPIEYSWQDWKVRWIPLMAPFTTSEGMSGPVLNQAVHPMTMLGVEYPGAGPAGDEWAPGDLTWSERRHRWHMIRWVNALNRKDNETTTSAPQ